MGRKSGGRDMAGYVLLGSILGSFLGATVVMYIMSESREERKEHLRRLQKSLMEPVRAMFAGMAEEAASAFSRAVQAALPADRTGPDRAGGDEREERET